MLLKLLYVCIDGLFAFLLHVLKILRTIKSGLLRWKDGEIKVSVQVITRAMIIKCGSNRIPWLLHRAKMSAAEKQHMTEEG
jgi:hypothetical protein